MQAQHYFSDLRDMHFNLFEFLDATRGGMDEDSIRSILVAIEKLASNEIAASFADADRHPPTIGPDGTPILPESLKKSIKAWQDGDWHRLALREDMGGFGAPRTVAWAAFELVVGANASAGFYVFDTFISGVIGDEGTPEQRARFFPRYVDRRWGAAMVLTEPDAGSDVGSARTLARHVEGDVWEIEGTKRFITSGDYDLPENILHLVLARPVGAKPGTKGLSMFIVPKYWVNEDGSLGERNGMRCIGIEKKMGIKASVTCEMAYGDGDTPCRGLLVGNTHDGIRQMFNVIEGARLAIGFKTMSEVSTAYFNALKYAKERIQGGDLAQATAKDSPRVPIIRHPDVRRMLMHLKAHVHGMRALCYYVADMTQQLQDARADKSLEHKVDLLLPLVKGYCSDKGYELLSTALQVFGGSGYVQDHPIEQYIRDQKIDTIYEGTTHIQALDLLFRKIMKDGGTTLRHLMGEIQATLEQKVGGEALEGARAGLARALGDMQGIFMTLLGLVQKSVYHAGMQGNRVLFALAETVIAWLLVRQAGVAVAKLPIAKGDDVAFYTGKIAAAKWFCREVLPGLTLTRKLVEQSSIDIMDLPDQAF
jgi:alkylation response protein AidB-like acyl-CoA dehydrogenase